MTDERETLAQCLDSDCIDGTAIGELWQPCGKCIACDAAKMLRADGETIATLTATVKRLTGERASRAPQEGAP